MNNYKHAMLNVLRMLKQHGTDISRIKCTARKAAAIFVSAAFIACAATPALASGLMEITQIQGGNGGNVYGDSRTIYFGNYWQNYDGDISTASAEDKANINNYTKSAVKWRVLATDALLDPNDSTKTGILLLADEALYADQFHSNVSTNKWKDSEIRATLNNLGKTGEANAGFAGDAFNAKEYAAIADTTHDAGGTYSGHDISTTDKLFLLSKEEVNNTNHGFSDNPKRIATPTDLARNVKMYDNTGVAYVGPSGAAWWWLRSPGSGDGAYYVNPSGVYNYIDVRSYPGAVRAALNLNQESVLFLSAAVGGKSAETCDGAFGLDNTYAGDYGWKLTLKDAYDETNNPNGIAKPNVTTAEVVGATWDVNDLAETAKSGTKIIEISDQTPTGDGGLKIAYDGADTGDNMYVSALLKDTDGKYVNYAKVSDLAADTKIIDISNINAGNYTLCIYGEQENGDYQTDYASALSEHDITIPTGTPEPTINTVLNSAYAADGLTAKLSNNCELGFESGEYDTSVTVTDGETGTITADATNGTTLTGDISVTNGSTLTTENEFILGGAIALNNGTLNGDKLNITGELNTEGGSCISGNVTLTGDYNVNGTTNIAGTFIPKGNLNFNLDGEEKKNGYVFITAENKINLKDATVKLIQTEEGYKLAKGETMTLITKAENYTGAPEVEERGINGEENYKYLYSVGIENDALMLGCLNKGAADQTKSFSEARLAGAAALNSGSDLIATEVIDNIEEIKAAKGWEAFAAMKAAHSRYDTGSHITLNSYNIAAGVSKKISNNVTLGIFAEVGNGSYSTVNEFKDGNVNADGDIDYYGGGVLAKAEGKKTTIGQLYAEASVRAGHIKSDYNSDTFELGTHTNFDTSGSYIGAHAGIGYKWAMKDGADIDTYIKYLWNKQNGDSPTINGDRFDLSDINSHRLRAGLRYNSRPNSDDLKFFAGLAYEHEFDGTAKGTMGEYALLEPDFKGGSARAELGIKYDKKESPWKVELGLTGYAGKRESIGATLNAWYEFGGEKQKANPEPTAEATETTASETTKADR